MLSGAGLAANGKGGGLRKTTAAIRALTPLVAALLLGVIPAGGTIAASEDESAYEAANVPFRQGDYAAAKQLYVALLARQDAGGFKADDPRRLSVLYQLARCEYQLGEYRAAYDHAKPVSDALDKSGEAPPDRVFDIDNFVASLAERLDRWDDEVVLLQRMQRAATHMSGLEPIVIRKIDLRRSLALMRAGKVEEGRVLRQQVLRDIAADPAAAPHLPAALNEFGNLLQRGGFAEDAVETFERLIPLLGAEPSDHLAIARFNLATALRDLHRFDEAIDQNRQAAEMLEAVLGGADRHTISAIGGLGQTYDLAGRYAPALLWLGRAHDAARRQLGEKDPDTALYANNFADVYRNLGDLAAAERLDREALTIRIEALGDDDDDTDASRGNLALDLQLQQRYADAASIVQPMLDRSLAALGPDSGTTWELRERIAKHLSAGQLDQAAAEFAVLGDTASSERRALLLNARAALADRQGHMAEGQKLWEEAHQEAVKAFGRDHPITLDFFADVLAGRVRDAPASLLTDLRELDDAVLEWARREIWTTDDPQTRQRLLALFHTTRSLIGTYALAHPDPATAALLVETAERWKGIGLRSDRLLAQLAKTGDRETAAAARALAAPGASRRDPRLAALRAQLGQSSPAYAELLRREQVPASEIAAALRPGEVLIDYWAPAGKGNDRSGDHVIAAVITPDGPRRVRDLGDIGDFVAVSGIEKLFVGRDAGTVAYARFVQPLEEDIAGAQRIYLAPDGPLHLVPFEALPTPRGHYLLEEHEVVMVRSGTSLTAPDEPAAAKSGGVVIADAIDYGRGPHGETPLRALQSGEGAAIGAALRHSILAPVTLVTGRAASKSWLTHLSPPPRLLHLVTHGGYEPALGEIDDPLELADIALAGANSDSHAGFMTAAELTAVDLDGTDLVVLSACDTARGTASYAEGLAGLPSALAIAGARRSLLALWPVTDAGTAVFMQRFYEHLAATPGEYEAALRAAKLDVIAGRLALPNGAPDWKAFVMMRN